MLQAPLLSNQTGLRGHAFNSGMDSFLDGILNIYMTVLMTFIAIQILFAIAMILKRKSIFRTLLVILSVIIIGASIPFFLPGSSLKLYGVVVSIFGIAGLYAAIKIGKK